MSDEIQSMSYTQSALVYYNTATTTPGIFIEWERSGAQNVAFYKIQKNLIYHQKIYLNPQPLAYYESTVYKLLIIFLLRKLEIQSQNHRNPMIYPKTKLLNHPNQPKLVLNHP